MLMAAVIEAFILFRFPCEDTAFRQNCGLIRLQLRFPLLIVVF